MNCPFKKITVNYDWNGRIVDGPGASNIVAESRESFDKCDTYDCPAYQPAERISCSLCVRNK